MAKKLNILGLIVEDSAVGFYRLWQPLKALEKAGLANLKLTPTFDWGRGKNEAVKWPDLSWFASKCRNKIDCQQSKCNKCFWPDIIVCSRHDYLHYINLLMALKNYQVPVVVDTDDDVQSVRPFNPGYGSYNPNSDHLAWNVKLMSIADAITVSTPQLKEAHEKYGHPVHVVPNVLDLDTRSFPPKKRSKKIRIGWLGSACHWENLQIIQQAVKDIIANYPQVEFVYTNLYGDIWNRVPDQFRERVIPACREIACKDQWHTSCNKAYVTFDKYAKYINKTHLDIGLAPLYDNLFNRSKSNLRILEYWSDSVAVIASPVRPYKETITDGVDGLFALEQRDWYDAIERLVLDADLREKLKKNGRKSLEKWSLKAQIPKLYKTYQTIIAEFEPGRSGIGPT